jgi:glycosyltransferase XagB
MLDFRHDRQAGAGLSAQDSALAAQLLAAGDLQAEDASALIAQALRHKLPLADVLIRQGGLDHGRVIAVQADLLALPLVNPLRDPADPTLLGDIGAHEYLRLAALPWRRINGICVVLTSRPQDWPQIAAQLAPHLGPLRMALARDTDLTAALQGQHRAALVMRAETLVAADQSCRDWRGARGGLVILTGLVILAVLEPQMMITALVIAALAVMVLSTALKLAATLAGFRARTPVAPALSSADLPVITMLVPLYRETAIAAHLLARLGALRYPRALLDICLVLEEDDTTTRDTLARTRLPGWMRAITVPQGGIKTKPRALNYALPFARGSLIGVWDAEDAPDPDQLHIVAAHFAAADPQTACLQGVLDYYNPLANWLTRCFTIEYAAWFRVLLPGMARLGLVVPLGGTTLFFRRAVLETLGGWDAHNVTEDADLGLRLARRGYRTALIPSTTQEEANGRIWPWVRQRSRWLKGYGITYLVHMRAPRQLLADLGLWRFIGVQVLFLGTLAQFVLAPALWSLWLVPLGYDHPFHQWAAPALFRTVTWGFIIAEIFGLIVNLCGLWYAGKLRLAGWALTLPLYFPLGALAAYRGISELVTRPFYWDKTAHGILMPPCNHSAASTASASSFNRVTNAAEI